jgi:hypothetical protein
MESYGPTGIPHLLAAVVQVAVVQFDSIVEQLQVEGALRPMAVTA